MREWKRVDFFFGKFGNPGHAWDISSLALGGSKLMLKCMVNLKDFPSTLHFFGLVSGNDHCICGKFFFFREMTINDFRYFLGIWNLVNYDTAWFQISQQTVIGVSTGNILQNLNYNPEV